MSWGATADVDRFDDAVDWFRKRKVTLPNQLSPGHAVDSFWVGAGLELSQIESVFDKVATAIENGEDFATWRERVRGELLNDAHAETVFRNAAQRSYNAGRWHQMREPDVLQFRPYWIFDAILDDRTTTICEICNETIRPADDEWWNGHIPPLHHKCRSSIRNLRKSEAERLGIAKEGPDTSKDQPPGEWGAAPGTAAEKQWKPTPKDKDLKRELKRKAERRLPRQAVLPEKKPKAPQKTQQDKFTPETAQELLDGFAEGEWNQDNPNGHGYGTHARLWAQDALRKLGIEPSKRRKTLGVFVAEDDQMGGADAHAHLRGNTPGLVVARRGYFEELKKELAGVSSGKLTEAPKLRVMLHEEIHLSSRDDISSYTGKNTSSLIEEVTTELVAQRVSHRVGLFADQLEVTRNQYGHLALSRPVAYSSHIVPVIQDVAEVTGWDHQTALERITDAGVAMRTDETIGLKSHFESFLALIKVDSEAQRAKLRTYLEIRTL